MSKIVTLIITHAGSYCPEVWDPVIARLRQSPLYSQEDISIDIVPFTNKYHGKRYENSTPVELDLSDPENPRAWASITEYQEWAPDDIYAELERIWKQDDEANKPRRDIIGVGHSFGGASLWLTEVRYPGTFAGLALFEPVTSRDQALLDYIARFYIPVTLKRKWKWDSREEAEAYFANYRGFRKWDKDAIKGYVKGAIVKANEDPSDSTVMLALHPHVEAAGYCSRQVDINDEEASRVQCRVIFHGGDKSQLYQKDTVFRQLEAQMPDKYSVGEDVANTGHLLVMEDPETVSRRVLQALERFPPFQKTPLTSRLPNL